MAKALNVPTFTIFSPWIKKEAWGLFEDKKQNVSVHLKDFKPELYFGKTARTLKKNWKHLYEQFSPNFFIFWLKKHQKFKNPDFLNFRGPKFQN